MDGTTENDEVVTRSATPQVRRSARWIAAIAIVLAAVGWWLMRSNALEPVADAVGFEAFDDQTRLTSYVVTNRRPIELVSVRPANQPPEGVNVSFVACRWPDPLQAFATGSGSPAEHCAEMRDVEGLVLEPNVRRPVGHGTLSATRDWDVLAVIDLGDQPSYVTEGFVVHYREGLRRGRQATGARVAVYRPGHERDW